MKKKKKIYKGFSLIEMVLAVLVAAIISVAVGRTFLAGTASFEKSRKVQNGLEEGRSSLETMAKHIRMSSFTNISAGNNTIYMYNNSGGICVSYQFDNTNKILRRAECSPPFESVDGENVPLGPNSSDKYNYVCDATVGNPCSGGGSYSYNDMALEKVTGSFSVTKSQKSGSLVIGRATVRMTTGSGTETGGAEADTAQTLQTTVSFRDYMGIIQ